MRKKYKDQGEENDQPRQYEQKKSSIEIHRFSPVNDPALIRLYFC